MMLQQFFKTIWILILLIGFFTSCKKNEDIVKQDIQIKKIIVNNEGEFAFNDGLIYLVNDTLKYEINIQTEPMGMDMFYSKNTDDFVKVTDDWILIDSTFKSIRFYAQAESYNVTEVYKMDVGFKNDSLAPSLDLYPNPFVDNIDFRLNSENIRGEYNYTIIDRFGRTILTNNGFISADEVEKNIDLSDLSSGMYFIQFNFGNTKLISKLVKQ